MNKDLAIYRELAAAAAKVFEEGITAPAGRYTLADLAKIGTKANTDPLLGFRVDYDIDTVININVGSFSCTLPAERVFLLARKFETLAKVSKDERAFFVRKSDHEKPIAVFTMDAVTVENLTACENPRKGTRPHIQGVFCDFAAGLSCCTNGQAVNIARLADVQVIDNAALNSGALNNSGVILPQAFAKSVKGCKVSIYKDGSSFRAVADTGMNCEVENLRYPNYKSVFTNVDESHVIHFAKNIKDFKKNGCVARQTV